MKLRFFAVFIVPVLLFCGCTGIKNDEPVYVYAVGLDENGAGIQLCALVGKPEEGEKGKNDGGSLGGGEKSTDAYIITAQGNSVQTAFANFFAMYDDIYTGTVKKYVAGIGFDDNGIRELEIYLASTGKLPVKRDIERQDNPYKYLEENIKALTEKQG